jgi:hypothetical protein
LWHVHKCQIASADTLPVGIPYGTGHNAIGRGEQAFVPVVKATGSCPEGIIRVDIQQLSRTLRNQGAIHVIVAIVPEFLNTRLLGQQTADIEPVGWNNIQNLLAGYHGEKQQDDSVFQLENIVVLHFLMLKLLILIFIKN